ncbi:MAG: hypothetical protein D6812_01510 [Deltaproteobacteria bacterium]|nr:MAG: hypothetical protein D6812_01510 [Deltaproteobacteria bacterium]
MIGLMLAGWLMTVSGDPVGSMLFLFLAHGTSDIPVSKAVSAEAFTPVPIQRVLHRLGAGKGGEQGLPHPPLWKLPVSGKSDTFHAPGLMLFTFRCDRELTLLTFESWGIEEDGVVEILLNGYPIGFVEGYGGGGWSPQRRILLPRRLLASGRENWVGFRNREGAEGWALRRIALLTPAETWNAYAPSPAPPPAHPKRCRRFSTGFGGRPPISFATATGVETFPVVTSTWRPSLPSFESWITKIDPTGFSSAILRYGFHGGGYADSGTFVLDASKSGNPRQ